MNPVYFSLLITAVAMPVGIWWRKASYALVIAGSLEMAVFTLLGSGNLAYPLAYFSLIASIAWILISIFSMTYSAGYGKWLTPLFAMTVFGMMVILESSDYVTFIIGWEIMSIPAYASIGLNKEHWNAAYVFMVFSEISTVFLVIGAIFAVQETGTMDFRFQSLTSDLPLLLIAIGCMTKMGITPFMISEWLPIAHGNAPANDSALFSATMTLMGVFGIARIMLLSPSSIYLGFFMLAVGVLTVFFAALFAYVSENMKMLGGFSTIENNGSILAAIGLYVALGEGVLKTYLLAVIMIFALAHSVAKTGLFIGIGTTRKENFSEVDSSKNSFLTLGWFLVTMSLSGLLPTIGGLGTWMLLESFFMGAYQYGLIGIASVVAGSMIALAEGLASASMMKVLSFSQVHGHPKGSMKNSEGYVLLSTGVILILLFVLANFLIQPQFISGLPSVLVYNGFTIQSKFSAADFGLISPLYVLVIIIFFALAAYLVFDRRKGKPRIVPRWNGGVDFDQYYTSFAYASNIRLMLKGILRTRIRDGNRQMSVVDVFWFAMQSFASGYRRFARQFAYRVMNSSITWYMIYMIVAFMLVLILAFVI
ncbi:MAG: proton-conducting transporter membrane subunit [Thermoplasmataceae archaeon]|jgi:formate hydrogenlyase subunit 3/multisubunit Na+/H+ antiporter MnhD subunit